MFYLPYSNGESGISVQKFQENLGQGLIRLRGWAIKFQEIEISL